MDLEASFTRLTEKLNEQVWFQELKQKWLELDPQSRTNLKYVSSGLLAIFLLSGLIYGGSTVSQMKQELKEKNELLQLIQSSSDELRNLKASGVTLPQRAEGGGSEEGAASWQAFIEQTAVSAGLDKASVSVQGEKPLGKTETAQEQSLEVSVKKSALRQITRFAYLLENSPRPVKVRELTIEGKGDPGSPLDAQLTLSAFTLQP